VSLRLTDESISVRDAAVSLVGAYVVRSPAVATCFQASLLGCLKDVGVSVRKRAVRIFQEILLSNPRYRGRSVVCDALLQQAADPREEDSVRDLIHDLFVKLWLENGNVLVPAAPKGQQGSESPASSSEVSSNGVATGPGVVTPTPPAPSRKNGKVHTPAVQKRVDVAAEQMMEVVRAAGTNEHLETLLLKLLHGTKDGDKGKKKAERMRWEELCRNHCDQIVNSLFELLLSIEEQRSRRPRVGKDLAATLMTISSFSELAPDAVLHHIQSLVPYLKADNAVPADDESSIVGSACDILHRLTTVRGQQTCDQVATAPVAKDLVQITYKFGTSVSESAVRALSAIAECQEAAGDNSLFRNKLLELVKTFYGYLYKKQSIDDFSSATVSMT